jgi:hypothetical protein
MIPLSDEMEDTLPPVDGDAGMTGGMRIPARDQSNSDAEERDSILGTGNGAVKTKWRT